MSVILTPGLERAVVLSANARARPELQRRNPAAGKGVTAIAADGSLINRVGAELVGERDGTEAPLGPGATGPVIPIQPVSHLVARKAPLLLARVVFR